LGEFSDVLLCVMSGDGKAKSGGTLWDGWWSDCLNEEAPGLEVEGGIKSWLIGANNDWNDGCGVGIDREADGRSELEDEIAEAVAKVVPFGGGKYSESGMSGRRDGDRRGRCKDETPGVIEEVVAEVGGSGDEGAARANCLAQGSH
jgi:hypothetical protein